MMMRADFHQHVRQENVCRHVQAALARAREILQARAACA
jgi:hypothetical protein